MRPSVWWKTMIVGAGLVASVVGSGTWAYAAPEVDEVIAAHRAAATEATKQAAFHDKMAGDFTIGKAKGPLAGHCKAWAAYYRTQAEKEARAAKQLDSTRGTH